MLFATRLQRNPQNMAPHMSFTQKKWDGRQISEPGIYTNMPNEAYHNAFICAGDQPIPDGIKIEGIKSYGPSISSSGLRAIFNQSPAHFFLNWGGNPKMVEREDAAHFRVGRAVHHLMLGEKFFSKLFAVQPTEWPDKDGILSAWHNGRTVCKAWNAAREGEGRAVLTKADVVAIKNMVIALEHNPIVQAGALNGLIERSIFWQDKDTGIWLKSRPDSIPGDSGDFVDLKTTVSTQWRDMVRTLGDLGYHAQGSLICEGARTVLKVKNPTFTLIFAEKKPPYCTRVVTLKENDLALGDRQNRKALDTFADCLKNNDWPGPGGHQQDAMHIELDDRARQRIQDRIDYGI